MDGRYAAMDGSRTSSRFTIVIRSCGSTNATNGFEYATDATQYVSIKENNRKNKIETWQQKGMHAYNLGMVYA